MQQTPTPNNSNTILAFTIYPQHSTGSPANLLKVIILTPAPNSATLFDAAIIPGCEIIFWQVISGLSTVVHRHNKATLVIARSAEGGPWQSPVFERMRLLRCARND